MGTAATSNYALMTPIPGRQNYPVIKSAKQGEGNTTIIKLKLNSTPNTEFDLEVFEGQRKKPDAEKLIGTSDGVLTTASGKFSQKYTLLSKVKKGHRDHGNRDGCRCASPRRDLRARQVRQASSRRIARAARPL